MKKVQATISAFPTLIYRKGLLSTGRQTLSLNRQLLEEIDIYRNEDLPGQKWSQKNYRHGFTSYGSRDRLFDHSPTFKELARHIDGHVKNYLEALYHEASLKTVKLNTMWLNWMPKGSYHTMHIHPQSVISGTYYVSTPKGSGRIRFQDPRSSLFMNSPKRKRSAPPEFQNVFEIEPQAGDLVLFESWLNHEVSENKASQARVSVSFNYDWN